MTVDRMQIKTAVCCGSFTEAAAELSIEMLSLQVIALSVTPRPRNAASGVKVSSQACAARYMIWQACAG